MLCPICDNTPVAASHFLTFASPKDYRVIKHTIAQLAHCGFYWGALSMEQAHGMLYSAPPGTFLVRDSRQKDVFFTLTFRPPTGKDAISVRIIYHTQRFWLEGSSNIFSGLFELLQHYTVPPRSLTLPYRTRMPTLKELCRRRLTQQCGGRISTCQLPLPDQLQNFLSEFPYDL